jgi:hypothetical protein
MDWAHRTLAAAGPKEKNELLTLLLQDLQWGPDRRVTGEVFEAICAAFTVTSVELAVVRFVAIRPEMLLFRRPTDDRFFGGQWHSPGSLRYGPEPTESVMERIQTHELGGLDVGQPTYVQSNFCITPRGAEVSELYIGLTRSEYVGPGEWFPLHALPPDLIEHHRTLAAQVKAWVDDDSNWLP